MDNNREIITASAEETANIGRTFGVNSGKKVGKGADIYCLYGDLGSGKTTFTQGVASGLGITSRLPSPTFIIVRRYDIPASDKLFYHIDLYRLNSVSEMEELGFDELFADPKAIVVIEWPERLGDELPEGRTDIHFTVLPDERHKIVIEKS